MNFFGMEFSSFVIENGTFFKTDIARMVEPSKLVKKFTKHQMSPNSSETVF